MMSLFRPFALFPGLGVTLLFQMGALGWISAETADTLPAFRPDSTIQESFRRVESGPSPWSANPAAASIANLDGNKAGSDTVSARFLRRHPAVSGYIGVDFMDFDAKTVFQAGLAARLARDTSQGLQALQNYEPVHLAFPLGLQAAMPIGAYLDLVAKTHSFWYKQTAIIGDRNSNHIGEEFYAVQANLGGVGLRYYIPASFLSVKGGLGLYMQGLLYWNLGNSQIYTNYGATEARFNPLGSGYELQFGIQQDVKGPWQMTGAIGFLKHQFRSDKAWSSILRYGPPAGTAHWAGSAIQATLSLWYHFGTETAPEGRILPAPTDSSRGF